jgi:hypothetical protein
VAKGDKRRRGRSRKRRPAPAAAGGDRRAAQARKPAPPARDSAGRPTAPWHPLPLSELLILIGGIGVAVSVAEKLTIGTAPLFLGSIAAILIGTVEVTLREHLGGYRSHALLLSLLATIAFHSLVVVVMVLALGAVPRLVNIVLLLPDALLFTALFKLLRARFFDARRERMFSGAR